VQKDHLKSPSHHPPTGIYGPQQRASASVRRALTVILENDTSVGQCVEVRRDDAARRVHEIHLVVAQICTPRPWTSLRGWGTERVSARSGGGRALHALHVHPRSALNEAKCKGNCETRSDVGKIEEFMRSFIKAIQPSLSTHMHSMATCAPKGGRLSVCVCMARELVQNRSNGTSAGLRRVGEPARVTPHRLQG
jgi:hypothetical protein